MCRFGELLAELRKDKKLSQRDLGSILHVSVGTISNYERLLSKKYVNCRLTRKQEGDSDAAVTVIP